MEVIIWVRYNNLFNYKYFKYLYILTLLIILVRNDIDFFTSSGIDITYSNITGVSGVINQATKVSAKYINT